MKTHTIHRSIDLEDTLTLQVTRPTKENNLACLLQSTLHLMQIEGIRYRYSLKILLLFADWMGVTHIQKSLFVIDVYESYYLRLYSGIKESIIYHKSLVCCVHGGLQQKNLVLSITLRSVGHCSKI